MTDRRASKGVSPRVNRLTLRANPKLSAGPVIAKPDRDKARPSHNCANVVRRRRIGRDASTIAELYKARWEVELLFKELKQFLKSVG